MRTILSIRSAYAVSNNISQEAHYNWVCERIDPENLINYYVPEVYYNNGDWPHNNLGLWRKRTDAYVPDAPRGHDGRWRWLLYDTDFGMGLYGGYTENTLSRVLTSTGIRSDKQFVPTTCTEQYSIPQCLYQCNGGQYEYII